MTEFQRILNEAPLHPEWDLGWELTMAKMRDSIKDFEDYNRHRFRNSKKPLPTLKAVAVSVGGWTVPEKVGE